MNKSKIENRKQELESELVKVKQEIENSRLRLSQLEQTAFQINGALIICDEFLKEEEPEEESH